MQGLAFVLGLDISWGKVVVLVAKATAVPMSTIAGEWSWALWVGLVIECPELGKYVADARWMTQIPAIVCGVNILLTFGYMIWIRTLPEKVRMCEWCLRQRLEMVTEDKGSVCAREGAIAAASADSQGCKGNPIVFLVHVLHSGMHQSPRARHQPILIAHIPPPPQICQAGVVGGFNGLSADIIRATRGTTAQIAGYQGERTRLKSRASYINLDLLA